MTVPTFLHSRYSGLEPFLPHTSSEYANGPDLALTLFGSRGEWSYEMSDGRKRTSQNENKDKHSPETIRVHKIMGQLQGIEKMLNENRPLSQVVQQVQAATAGLSSLKLNLLNQHLEKCLSDSMKTGDYHRLLQEVAHIIRMQMRR